MNRLIFLFILFCFFTESLFGQEESFKIFDDSEIAVVKITMDPNDLELMLASPRSDIMRPASVYFRNSQIDETVDSVGVRIRGNTSRDSEKKSFKISFDEYLPGREFYNLDKLNLNGEHNDPSIMRSKMSWDLFNSIGMVSSRAAHAAVYINEKYFGLYINVEHIDNEFVSKNFSDDTGNLWKCLWPADLKYKGSSPDLYKAIEAGGRRTYDLKTNEAEDDYSKLADFIAVVNNVPGNIFEEKLEEIFYVPDFIRYLAVNVLTASWDDYRFLKNNYYLYYEPNSDKIHFIPYDYDNSYGIDFNFNDDWAKVNPYNFGTIDGGERPLSDRVLANSKYRNLFTHFLEFYNENVFKLELYETEVDRIKSLMNPFAEADTFRTKDYGFSVEDFHQSFTPYGFNRFPAQRGLKEFINVRHSSLKSQLSYTQASPYIYAMEYHPVFPRADDTIYISASLYSYSEIISHKIEYYDSLNKEIRYFDMEFNPDLNSKLVEERDMWTGKIPPLGKEGFGSFILIAEDENSAVSHYPNASRIGLKTPKFKSEGILISEIMPRNNSVLSDQAGEFDDWLELYNSTSQQINLRNYFVTDDKEDLTKWQFSVDFFLEPGEYKIIWCDNDEDQGTDHTNFRLDGDGEFVALVKQDGITFSDSLSYPPIPEDSSYTLDIGTGDWFIGNPTPSGIPVGIKLGSALNPANFSLGVFPNPFNPSANFILDLNVSSNVKMEIYNVLGELVYQKDFGYRKEGNYKDAWHGNNGAGGKVKSGVYILRYLAGGNSITSKLVLLK